MKLLVMSDSHGHDENLTDIIMGHPDADALIFLGDGEWDFENAVNVCGIGNSRIICQVRGNCDRASREPDRLIREFGGVRFLITHGHEQNVKYGLWNLVYEAGKQNCSVALYGHTHYRSFQEKDGIMLINPGSAGEGKYCVVEIRDGNVSVSD